jgi:peptidoglycan/xylan/chitin deacetylase (PgdA/CDA1 family)
MRLLAILMAMLLTASPVEAAKRLALSFDDVPRAPGAFFSPDERTRLLIESLDRADVDQAAFFVTTGNLDRPYGAGGEARIAAYVAAGHVIANHSHSHRWLHRTPAEDYVADLDRAAAWLAGRRGYRPWHRFPFLDEGREDLTKRDAVRAALRERGLRNGYVTIDTYDWHLEDLARNAVQQGKAIDRDALRDLYVEALVELAEFNEQRAVETLGRSPAHMILLHETDLAAMFIADAVAALRARGWEIVPADEAYRDPIAVIEPETTLLGSGRIAAIAHAAGRPPRELVSSWTDEEVLSRLFAQRVLHEAPTP